jgi:hypothetical protein
MSLSGGTDRFGLARAILARRRHLPVRLASALIAAAGVHLTLGWELGWLWAAVFAAVQIVEHRLSQFLPRIAETAPGLAAGILCGMSALSSLIFGALAPALWIGGGHYGPALGVIVVSTAMTNLIAICRGSRLMFTVSALPYAVYLLAMPMMDSAQVSGPLLATMLIAAGLVLLNVIGAWTATLSFNVLDTPLCSKLPRNMLSKYKSSDVDAGSILAPSQKSATFKANVALS